MYINYRIASSYQYTNTTGGKDSGRVSPHRTVHDRCARADRSMDIATRYQPRPRGTSYLDQQRAALPDDSGTECEDYRHMSDATASTDNELAESLARRKFQRTVGGDDSSMDTSTFRKPTMPASASRPQQPEQKSSFSHRRRSTLRENVRVPSGPRDYSGSPAKRCAIVLSCSITVLLTFHLGSSVAATPASLP